MFRRFFLILIFLLGFTLLQSCQNDSNSPGVGYSNNNFSDDASLLLVSDEDPTGLEKDAGPAFRLDSRGMIFFFLLDLTEDQKEAIRSIHQKYHTDLKGYQRRWEVRNSNWQEIKAQRDSIHTLIEQEIVDLLTDSQRALWEEIQAQLANGEYPDALVAYRVQKLHEKLNLSDEQQSAISELIKNYGSQILQARNSSEHRSDFMEARRAIGEELNDEIRTLLTGEQIEIYEEILKNRQHKMRHKNRHKKH